MCVGGQRDASTENKEAAAKIKAAIATKCVILERSATGNRCVDNITRPLKTLRVALNTVLQVRKNGNGHSKLLQNWTLTLIKDVVALSLELVCSEIGYAKCAFRLQLLDGIS